MSGEPQDVLLNMPHVTEVDSQCIEYVVPWAPFERRRLYRHRIGHLIPGQTPTDIMLYGPKYFWIEGWSERNPFER